MSNWLVAIVGGAIATVIGGVVLFYLLPSQQTPAVIGSPDTTASPKHLDCTLAGGTFNGVRATFSLDLSAKKAEWQGIELEIRRLTEQHIYAYTGWHLDGDRFPPHNQIEFVFHRLTLTLEAFLRHVDQKCLGRLKPGELDFCDLIPNRVSEPSQGKCRAIVRPL